MTLARLARDQQEYARWSTEALNRIRTRLEVEGSKTTDIAQELRSLREQMESHLQQANSVQHEAHTAAAEMWCKLERLGEDVVAKRDQVDEVRQEVSIARGLLERMVAEGSARTDVMGAMRQEISAARELLERMVGEGSAKTDVMDALRQEISAARQLLERMSQEEAARGNVTQGVSAAVNTALQRVEFLAEAAVNASGAYSELLSTSRASQSNLHDVLELVVESREYSKAINEKTDGVARRVQQLQGPVIPGRDVVVVQVEGLLLGIPQAEWRLSSYYHLHGPLEPGVFQVLARLLKPGMTFVDVGANVGLYTLQAARALGADGVVHSFEPFPEVFGILEQNVQLNGFRESGVVRLHNAAVADKTGELQLYFDGRDSTHNSLFADGSQQNHVTVRSVSLDDVLSGAQVDVVKIDAEGAEPLVFDGMRSVLECNRELQMVIEFAPGHLRRSGANPGAFLASLVQDGRRVLLIDDTSGELRPAEVSYCLSRDSSNLLVCR